MVAARRDVPPQGRRGSQRGGPEAGVAQERRTSGGELAAERERGRRGRRWAPGRNRPWGGPGGKEGLEQRGAAGGPVRITDPGCRCAPQALDRQRCLSSSSGSTTASAACCSSWVRPPARFPAALRPPSRLLADARLVVLGEGRG